SRARLDPVGARTGVRPGGAGAGGDRRAPATPPRPAVHAHTAHRHLNRRGRPGDYLRGIAELPWPGHATRPTILAADRGQRARVPEHRLVDTHLARCRLEHG